MDIVESLSDQGLNEECEAKGLNPVAVGDQDDGLRGDAGRLRRGRLHGL